jgi:hypothetical protein
VSASLTADAGVAASALSLTHSGALTRVLAVALASTATAGAHRADAR